MFHRKKAFTLIELLVVIAIISILAAILFPVFGRARENARKASCASNLKSIGMAWLMYAQDYDEKVPLQSTALVGNKIVYWYASYIIPPANIYNSQEGLIQPYMKSVQILDCPSNTIPIQGNLQHGYGVNYLYLDYPNYPNTGWATNQVRASLGSIPVPAETILMADQGTFLNTGGPLRRAAILNPPSNAAAPSVQGRHNGFANVLWYDGHVKAIKPTPRAANFNANVTKEIMDAANLGDLCRDGDCEYYYKAIKTP